MKIKGKATFELTNVETGEKRVVKEENMVTNAFKYMVEGFGVYGSFYRQALSGNMEATMSKTSYGNNMLRILTNGLVLFGGNLEEDADHVYMTGDDPEVVGVGADIAYVGNQVCAGSYNKTESGPIENGYKHVWDFTTSQANGDIGCACLTSIEGASIGFGLREYITDWKGRLDYFPIQHSFELPKIDDHFTDKKAFAKYGYIDEGRNLFIRIKDYFSFPLYKGSTATEYVHNEPDVNGNIVEKNVFDKTFLYKKSIDLNVYRFPITQLSLFDNLGAKSEYFKSQGTTTTSVSYNDLQLLDTVTVNMPEKLAALIPDNIVQSSLSTTYYWPTALNVDDGFMYISFVIPTKANTVPKVESGKKIYTWKINLETFESTWFSITNTTGQTLNLSQYATPTYRSDSFVIVTNNYTVLFSDNGNGNAWVIDNATGSTIKQLVNSFDDPINLDANKGYFVHKDILYLMVYSQNAGYMPVINLKTGVVKYVYVSDMSKFTYVYSGDMFSMYRTFGTKFPKLVISYAYSNYCRLSVYIDPQFLMTINNLGETVTKTSADTMKVTYVITQSEDDL